jgi:hypothetical protein
MSGGYGNNPWGGAWGGSGEDAGNELEHIPTSALWTQFDLTGVRQSNDMDRVRDFVEATGYGNVDQFFVNSFNLASGGSFSATTALLDIAVPVLENYTVEYRMAANQLPDDFSDPVNRHMVLAVNNAAGACTTLLLSQGGIAYTGAISYDLNNQNQISFDHILNPGGVTVAEKSLIFLPGSDEWFDEGQEIYVRVVVDWENQLVYLFVTPANEITPGQAGADSIGHVLRALLPVIPASTAVFPPIDRIAVSVKGTLADESNLELFHYNLSSRLLIPDLPPRALTGPDQASRLCSIIQLDGSGSFDPEGNVLTYDWRLIDGPETSMFVGVGNDGQTAPEAIPTGFTDQFFSAELGTLHNLEPVQPKDVLLVGGIAYTIVSVKPPLAPGTFYVLVERAQIPDNLSLAGFKLLRQSGITDPTTAKPTFYPDVAGFFVFDLRVFDGVQWSTPNGLERAVTVVNVLESPLPRGCTPDLSFIFDYLSDFWRLVEDSEKMHVFWGALAQTAATELYTLWQHDYSKSVRDIQRVFARRWLHYDLVLGEPLPEVTKVFPVWSGVTSTPFSVLAVNNQRLGISTPVLESPEVITFTGLDPANPYDFARGLTGALQGIDKSFSAKVVELPSSQKQIQLTASIPFTITNDTTILFAAGSTNGAVEGSGETTTARAFKVDRSLQGLNLSEAFLVIGDSTYVIDRVIDVSGDAYPYQRVVVRSDIQETAGPQDFVITGWVSSELLNFYNGLVTRGDHVDFEVLDSRDDVSDVEQVQLLVSTTAYGASPTFPRRLPVDFGPLGVYLMDSNVTVRLARVLRRGRLPVDDLIVDIPVLQENVVITDDEASLRRNLDFFIEPFRGYNSVRFVSGQGGGPDVFEGARPPFRLWAEYTYVNNNPTIEANFGELAGFSLVQVAQLPTSVDYLAAVSGLMYAYTNGPTLRNLRIGTQILIGLPYAEEDGTIEELRRDLLSTEGRILVRDKSSTEIVRSYTYPKVLELEVNPDTGERYKVGDSVTRFSPLVEGAGVVDYIKDPTWFQGILNQGVFLEVQKFHTFAVRVDGRAFSLASLGFVRDFILKIKPTYTLPKFIVTLAASNLDGDEISVNDTVSMRGALTLDDGVCRELLGASYVFDQAWPGGGQAWAGDTGNNHNSSWRNKFDQDSDPNTVPVYPLPENPVLWGYDKGALLCPADDVAAYLCDNFPAPFTPQYDSVFSFDSGVFESFEGTTAGPVNVLAGAVGTVLTLTDNTVDNIGALHRLNVSLLGANLGATNAYEMVVSVNAVPQAVLPFVASGVNQELLFSGLAIPVTAADVVQVSIRTQSLAASGSSWVRVLVVLSSEVTWTFDDTLSAGTYCGIKELTG